MSDHPSTDFRAFVEEYEAGLDDDGRAELEAWRAHFRGDDGSAALVPAPDPKPPRGSEGET